MSFSVEDKLPENYFKEVMEEKAEMIRMHLDDLAILWVYNGNFQVLFLR